VKELILGGARSGKSSLAEQYAFTSGLEVSYIATAGAGDAEMAARIAMHRARRPSHWRLVEESVALLPLNSFRCSLASVKFPASSASDTALALLPRR